MMSYRCTMGSGVIRMVGTGGIVTDSLFITVLSSWFWKMEKTKVRRDRLNLPQSPHRTGESDKKQSRDDNR